MSDYINRLPDEMLALIFVRLPLINLVHLELVSHRWQSVQQYVLARIDSLTLYTPWFSWYHVDFFQLMFFEPLHYSPYYNKTSLKFQESNFSQSQTICEWLVRKMPNITKLSLWGVRFESEDFDILFNQWTQLEQLYMSGVGDEFDWDDFCPRLNRVTLLKHFAAVFEVSTRFDPTLFPQLETLCIEHFMISPTPFKDIICNLGPNIRHLSTCDCSCSNEDITSIRNTLKENKVLTQSLATQVTHLTYQSTSAEYNPSPGVLLLNFFADYFGSVTHLDICVDDLLFLHQIVGPLSRFKRLTVLRLSTIATGQIKDINILKGNVDEFGNGIPSVKTLHLSMPCSPTPKFYSHYLPLAFPSLKSLRFENLSVMFKCESCVSNDFNFDLVYRLFDGGPLCFCPKAIWNSLREKNVHLESVFRNNHLVFDRKSDCYERFEYRLGRYGQATYKDRMFHDLN